MTTAAEPAPTNLPIALDVRHVVGRLHNSQAPAPRQAGGSGCCLCCIMLCYAMLCATRWVWAEWSGSPFQSGRCLLVVEAGGGALRPRSLSSAPPPRVFKTRPPTLGHVGAVSRSCEEAWGSPPQGEEKGRPCAVTCAFASLSDREAFAGPMFGGFWERWRGAVRMPFHCGGRCVYAMTTAVQQSRRAASVPAPPVTHYQPL